MEIDYKKAENEFIEFLDKNKTLVLATSADDRVTARMMSCVNIGTEILFQTDKKFMKVEQIRKNKKVALCFGSFQIEGDAEIGKHPFDEENREFLQLYKESHNGSFEAYSGLKDNVVVKVSPKLVKIWKYIGDKPFIEELNIEKRTAKIEEYRIDERRGNIAKIHTKGD